MTHLPTLKLLTESITDRNNLTKALQTKDVNAAKKAIMDLMHNKKIYNTPAQELGVEDSEFREILNSVQSGDLDKAAKVLGVGGSYQPRGIGASSMQAGPGKSSANIKTIFEDVKKLIEKYNGYSDKFYYKYITYGFHSSNLDKFEKELENFALSHNLQKKAGYDESIWVVYKIKDIAIIVLDKDVNNSNDFEVSIDLTNKGNHIDDVLDTFESVFR